MKQTTERLLELNFDQIGEWVLDGRGIRHIDVKPNAFLVKNALYIFVKHSKKNHKAVYIGKTTQSLEKRFYGYIRGNGRSTNNRIHKLIQASLLSGDKIEIWALLDDIPIKWGPYNINLAAGLEDGMIADENPEWNGGKNEFEELEDEEMIESGEPTVKDTSFPIKISKTYYNMGIINPGKEASVLLGKHNEDIVIHIGEHHTIKSKINRTANSSGAVRTFGKKTLSEYYQKNYSIDDIARLEVLGPHEIRIV